jgi:glycosyltransferase involved in cell wall biosynthesis
MSRHSKAVVQPRISYIGCWYKNDMYSHNCSNFVEALRGCGLTIDVVTSNCRCFTSAQQFDIAVDELINDQCTAIKLPHAPSNPGKKKYGLLKYLAVKVLRLDLWLAIARGFLYYQQTRSADVIQYDQVLEAFGGIPLFFLTALAGRSRRRLIVTVHEIDPFQQKHRWINRMYSKCWKILVYSHNMKQALIDLGVESDKVTTIKYGLVIPELTQRPRTRYIYFGGHFILRGKGYSAVLGALELLRSTGVHIHLLIYVGHGCNGLDEAQAMASSRGLDEMIEWGEFFSGAQLAAAYQSCKACIIPYTGGSARHPITSAMASATPVIATRAADIPEYLGSLGIYVDGSSESIASAICQVETGVVNIDTLGMELRKRATAELDVAKIANSVSSIYSSRKCERPISGFIQET